MKKIRPILLIFLLLIVYIYVCSIALMPDNIILFQGENLNINTLLGVTAKQEEQNPKYSLLNNSNYGIMQTSSSNDNNTKIGNTSITLELFGTIPLKEIDVNVIPRTTVIPVGRLIGLRLYTEGVLVVGMSEITGQDNVKYKPYEYSGIEEGDTIIEVNNKEISNTEELINCVNNSNGTELVVKYLEEESNEIITSNITPVKTSENEYKLGLWVRDAAEGVGTITFYEPSTGKFAALGHAITDVDTGDIINISNGELITAQILSITKGERGKPGEIRGIISNGLKIGEIITNTAFGIFGNVTEFSNLQLTDSKEMEVALRSEIKEGKAYIMCELETGKVEQYEIEIQKIYSGNNYDNKNMLIKVVDPRLIEKTGGIVQGMSGSPIIQDDKFVGAVTHVLVQDPTQGYAVFADMMIKQMREVD